MSERASDPNATQPTRRFEGRVVLLTGTASGIGRASAELFAEEGARVACTDINESGLDETVSAIEKAGGEVMRIVCDVSSPDDAQTTVARVVEAWGGIHVLGNIAGTGFFAHVRDITPEQWNRVIAVNLSGTFFMSQAALPHLLHEKGSSIVNVASVAGLQGQAYSAAYCASKAGVVNLTRSMAVEFVKRGLRVNCVCPGVVETPIIQNFLPPEDADMTMIERLSLGGRITKPREVAEALAYLASDAAKSVNGVALPMDSGVHAA